MTSEAVGSPVILSAAKDLSLLKEALREIRPLRVLRLNERVFLTGHSVFNLDLAGQRVADVVEGLVVNEEVEFVILRKPSTFPF
ncbi:MAG: hypothetical protein ACRD5Z_13140 [Bryobacteraceae bacterium]